jgi:hypothetical protein
VIKWCLSPSLFLEQAEIVRPQLRDRVSETSRTTQHPPCWENIDGRPTTRWPCMNGIFRRQNASAVSTDALGTKKEIQTPEEADRSPDCTELKYVGTMAEV